MTRLLMTGVAVAALMAFGSMADAQQQQPPTYENQQNQGAGGGAGAGAGTQGAGGGAGAGASTQMQEEQPGTTNQSSETTTSGGSKKLEKKTGQAEGEGTTDQTNKKMEKKTGQTEGEGTSDKTKKTESQQEPSGATGATEKAGKIDIPEGKRSQVVKTFSGHKVKPAKIDIDVSVGVAIPRTVVLHPVPVDIVEVVPAFRRYKYFVLANGEIVIVDPATFVVVYVLSA